MVNTPPIAGNSIWAACREDRYMLDHRHGEQRDSLHRTHSRTTHACTVRRMPWDAFLYGNCAGRLGQRLAANGDCLPFKGAWREVKCSAGRGGLSRGGKGLAKRAAILAQGATRDHNRERAQPWNREKARAKKACADEKTPWRVARVCSTGNRAVHQPTRRP